MQIQPDNTRKRRFFGRWFARRATACVVVCPFLALLDACTSPRYRWVAWVAAGWGGLQLTLSLVRYLTGCDDERNYL
ncbi:hypothetical protein [Alistipes sp.]|uniref:hypothetical protein n=1 Tax=Alistipes sp. TaxID=1872444 RepID=UPI003AEF787D